MEKVVFYRVYYFEDLRKGERYYYEDKPSCEMARFVAYKRYDGERISKNNFVVPVSKVKSILINEQDLDKFEIFESLTKEENEPQKI